MAAPDLTTLFKFEEQLEDGFISVITDELTAGEEGVYNIYSRRGVVEKATPFVDVLAVVGAGNGHLHHDGTDDYEDQYTGRLDLRIVDSRAGGDADTHTLLARLRTAFAPSGAHYDTDSFPYLAIMAIRPAGTDYDVDEDINADVTTVSYEFDFCIRPDAWPA